MRCLDVKSKVEYAMKIMNKRKLRRKTVGPGMELSNEYDNVK